MTSGLLWYDNSKKPLAAKIESAAKRYREKFGVNPNRCFVNPAEPDLTAPNALNIQVATKTTVMPNHIWLGVDAPQTNVAQPALL